MCIYTRAVGAGGLGGPDSPNNYGGSRTSKPAKFKTILFQMAKVSACGGLNEVIINENCFLPFITSLLSCTLTAYLDAFFDKFCMEINYYNP